MRLSVIALFALALVIAAEAPASAQGSVPTEVLVVLAKEQPGSIDPQLAKMTALRRPPFNSFRSMRVLSRSRIKLSKGKDEIVKLPNGRRVKLNLLRTMPDGRYRVKTSINKPNKKDYLPLLQVVASPGDPFFVAGQAHRGGTLVVGVRVNPNAAAKGGR